MRKFSTLPFKKKLKRLLPMLDALEKVLIKIVSLVGWLIILTQAIGLK